MQYSLDWSIQDRPTLDCDHMRQAYAATILNHSPCLAWRDRRQSPEKQLSPRGNLLLLSLRAAFSPRGNLPCCHCERRSLRVAICSCCHCERRSLRVAICPCCHCERRSPAWQSAPAVIASGVLSAWQSALLSLRAALSAWQSAPVVIASGVLPRGNLLLIGKTLSPLGTMPVTGDCHNRHSARAPVLFTRSVLSATGIILIPKGMCR